MLVLTRKPGEKLLVGNDIEIVVTKVSGNRVTLGIKAPKEKRIVRGELDLFTEQPAAESKDETPADQDAPATIPLGTFTMPLDSGYLPRQAR